MLTTCHQLLPAPAIKEREKERRGRGHRASYALGSNTAIPISALSHLETSASVQLPLKGRGTRVHPLKGEVSKSLWTFKSTKGQSQDQTCCPVGVLSSPPELTGSRWSLSVTPAAPSMLTQVPVPLWGIQQAPRWPCSSWAPPLSSPPPAGPQGTSQWALVCHTALSCGAAWNECGCGRERPWLPRSGRCGRLQGAGRAE